MLTDVQADPERKSSATKAPTGKRFLAGDRSRPSTFDTCHQNEARVAAYVGYKDVASLRTFLLSPSFLKYYLPFDADWSKGMRVVGAFEQIRDVWLADNIRNTFSLSWNDVEKYKPSATRGKAYGKLSVDDKEQTDQYLAQILILMVEEYSQAASVTVAREEYETFSTKLKQLKQKVSAVPDIIGRQVHSPRLKIEPPEGRKPQESDLEPYNRALNLLRHMSHITNNAWAGRYEKGFWDRANAVYPIYIPDFMHFEPIVVAPKYTVAETLKAKRMAEKKIILSWATARKDDEAHEYIKANYQLPFPPLTGVIGLGDPRVLDHLQYRDSLRISRLTTHAVPLPGERTPAESSDDDIPAYRTRRRWKGVRSSHRGMRSSL
jgi:hypothetical protein